MGTEVRRQRSEVGCHPGEMRSAVTASISRGREVGGRRVKTVVRGRRVKTEDRGQRSEMLGDDWLDGSDVWMKWERAVG